MGLEPPWSVSNLSPGPSLSERGGAPSAERRGHSGVSRRPLPLVGAPPLRTPLPVGEGARSGTPPRAREEPGVRSLAPQSLSLWERGLAAHGGEFQALHEVLRQRVELLAVIVLDVAG